MQNERGAATSRRWGGLHAKATEGRSPHKIRHLRIESDDGFIIWREGAQACPLMLHPPHPQSGGRLQALDGDSNVPFFGLDVLRDDGRAIGRRYGESRA